MKYTYIFLVLLLFGCQVIAPHTEVYYTVSCPKCAMSYDTSSGRVAWDTQPFITRSAWKSEVVTYKKNKVGYEILLVNEGAGFVEVKVFFDGKEKKVHTANTAKGMTSIIINANN